MIVEFRIPEPIDEDSAEWVHYCYVSNINKAVQKLQELFNKEQEKNGANQNSGN